MSVLRPLLAAALAIVAGCGGSGGQPPETEILEDMEFPAFLGGETGGDPVSVHLGDYSAESMPGTRILMISTAAGWCAPCMREAEAMSEFAAAYEPRGVAILTGVFQDQNGNPASADFVKAWVDNFSLSVPALIDESFQLSKYVDVSVMPTNIFVDAETLEILEIATGARTGDDPMQEYRELLDFYLAE
ncbi:MAG TPA: TlpA disulfide reductase family protein [Kofleriaceae bacterium]|nr:TlpA disulfide reductase family protein [Kofleriaceae bacterium]